MLRYTVPGDTCYDLEDGSTRRLTLHLLTPDRKELSPRSWLNFDVRNQEFFGVPLEEEVGRTEYQLVCSDRRGLSAVDGVEVVVLNRPFSERFGTEFVLVFDGPVEHRRVELVEKLAAFFGHDEAENVIVKSVEENTLVWYNKTLAYAECESPAVDFIRSKLVLEPGGTNASQDALRHFRSTFKLVRAAVVPRGVCVAVTDSPEVTQQPTGDRDDSGGFFFHGIIPSSEYLMTFLVPAVIITCMLLLAIILACVLHRKRKAGKLNLFYSEALPPRVPVILQDELFEDPLMGAGGGVNNATVPRRRISGGGGGGETDGLLGSRLVMQQPQDSSSLPRPTPTYTRRS